MWPLKKSHPLLDDVGYIKAYRKSFAGRVNSEGKIPNVRLSLAILRTNHKASVVESEKGR